MCILKKKGSISFSSRVIAYLLIGITAGVLFISVVWKSHSKSDYTKELLDENIRTQMTLEQTALPRADLSILQSNGADSVNLFTGKKVLIAFSPTDCGVCLEILKTLNEKHVNGENQMPIIGIVNTPYRQVIWKFQQEYQLSFPLVYDSLGVIRNSLSAGVKPALLLVDKGNIEKLAIVGAPEDVDDVRDIMQNLLKKPKGY